MKTILVPTDFSNTADNACKYAIEIAKHTNAKIILMHVYETPVFYTDVSIANETMDFSIVYDSALQQLKGYYTKIRKAAGKITVELVLKEGLASARIKEIAIEKKADLIVLGTTGKGTVERIFIGSNALRIIRKAPCLVLAVPPRAKFQSFKKIVFATDLSKQNLKHTKALVLLGEIFNSQLIFLNIDIHFLSGDRKNYMNRITQKIKKYVRYPEISAFVCQDVNIPGGINLFLKKNKADCLSIYTHRKGFLNRLFNPSITKSIVLHSSVPLLVIHEKDVRK